MYISNSSSGMATLLQQKNCMKTLTNGGNVVSGSSAGGSAQSSVGSSLNGGGGSTNTVVVTNGAVVGAATGNNVSSGGGVGVGMNNIHHQGQQAATRLLMPHVSLPIGSIISTGNIGHGTSNTQGAFLVAGYPQQQQQQIVTSESLNSYLHNSNSNLITTGSAASMFSHNDNHQTVVSNTAASPPSSTPAAGQTTRYFSQFSNQSATSANLPSSASSLSSAAAAAGSLTNFNHRITNNFNQNFRNGDGGVGGSTLLPNRITQQQQHSHQIHHNVTIIKTEQSEPPTTNTTTTTTTTFAAAAKSIATSRHRYGTSTLQQIKTEAEAAATANNNTDNENKIDVVHQKFPLNGVPKGGAGNSIKEEPIFTGATEETNAAAATAADVIVAGEDEAEPEPEIDIVINNVVCSFSVRCHLNLREIALNGFNVEFRRENGMVTMKLRRPYTTASIWSSGRITCTGATSEDQAKIAARRYARCLQKLGFRVRFNNFRVVNVLGTCSMPWAIKIVNFSERYKKEASYEPELHPGVTYKLRFPKATLKIFSTGSITVTAASVANVQAAIEHIFPLVYEFRKKRTPEEMEALRLKQQLQQQQQQQQQQQHQISDGRTYLETADLNEDIIIDLVHSPPRTSIASAAASNKQVTILSASSSPSPSSCSSKLPLTAKNKRKRKLIDAGEIKDCDDPDDPDDVSRTLGDREIIRINTADEDDVDGDDDNLIMNSTRDGGGRSGSNTGGVFMVTEYDDPDDLIEGPDELDDDIDDDDDDDL